MVDNLLHRSGADKEFQNDQNKKQTTDDCEDRKEHRVIPNFIQRFLIKHLDGNFITDNNL